jgi:hypothetical protein
MLFELNLLVMGTGNQQLERLRQDLDLALEAADDDGARYHIRRAAQRVEIIRTGMDETQLETELPRLDDQSRSDSDA